MLGDTFMIYSLTSSGNSGVVITYSSPTIGCAFYSWPKAEVGTLVVA